MASLAMLLGVQTLHSPIVHMLECGSDGCHVHSQTSSHDRASDSSESEAHVHVHVHHGHVHVHVHHTNQSESCGDSTGDSPVPIPHEHSENCQLCQFLTQALHPVMLPVLLTGEEAVSAPPVDLLPEVVLVPLTGPYVRGPPLSV